jgi:hypothetical protein
MHNESVGFFLKGKWKGLREPARRCIKDKKKG